MKNGYNKTKSVKVPLRLALPSGGKTGWYFPIKLLAADMIPSWFNQCSCFPCATDKQLVIAQYDFASSSDRDLPLAVGDKLEVLCM